MQIILVNNMFLICCWSGVLVPNDDLQYNVGIELCEKRCFKTDSCFDIKLDSGNVHCKRKMEGAMTRSERKLLKLHPNALDHVPHLQCEESQRIIKTRKREYACSSGQSNEASSDKVTISTVNTTTLATSFGKSGIPQRPPNEKAALGRTVCVTVCQSNETSSDKATITTVDVTALVPTIGQTGGFSQEISVTTTQAPVGVRLFPVLGEAAYQGSCDGSKCTGKRSVCKPAGPCLCRVGFLYNPRKNKCLKACSKYGTGMMFYKGIGIDGHNDYIIRKLTLEECAHTCVTFKKFLCKTFDYGREFNIEFMPKACYLSKVGYFEVPAKERMKGKAWIMGVRDCEK